MIIATAQTITAEEIPEKVRELSTHPENKGKYLIATIIFNEVHLSIKSYLGEQAPSSTVFDWYALNGRIRKFTDKQVIADQNATPVLM